MTDKSVRLINANAIQEAITVDYHEHFTQCHDTDQVSLINMVREIIDESPTIDAVPVVRCVDCKYFEAYQLGDGFICECTKNGCTIAPNDYCSTGRRVKHGKF